MIPPLKQIPIVRYEPTGIFTPTPQSGRHYEIKGRIYLCFEETFTGRWFAGTIDEPFVFVSIYDLRTRPVQELSLIPVPAQ